jgi:hypothetical protein
MVRYRGQGEDQRRIASPALADPFAQYREAKCRSATDRASGSAHLTSALARRVTHAG